MQIGKWGNSLAIRLPSSLVDRLALKEGDNVQIEVADAQRFRIARDTRQDDALAALEELGWTLPADFTFSREETHERGA